MDSGRLPAEAERLARSLASLHGGSSRDRMRLIFDAVPVIYGFSAKAPVGPVAASMLGGYFRSGGGAEIAHGQPSGKLLGSFRSTSRRPRSFSSCISCSIVMRRR